MLVGAVLVLGSGCASGSGSQTPPAGAAGSHGASQPQGIASGEPNPAAPPVTVNVAVTDGEVLPPTHRVQVPLGSAVELQVTSDVDDEVHVHGFDVEQTLEAGRTTTVTLQADQAGVFEVETHETELQLVQLEVR